ncbi:hypothetical protein G5B37_08445 [Rasiella rasia]|uniref:Uncharacterized protein n=1 Tax=Rasiella rasia TaxID=2744027 RepID=A0A6G6GM73_9FLAO|nr:hypothetical protein [Rasiella rasia]QIE59590.1 hypothetical protein G5B37_08445 [Rasiella rasia]
MKYFLILILCCIASVAVAQEGTSNYRTKKVAVTDTIQIDSVSINPSYFRVENKEGEVIDASQYAIDFKTSTLIFSENEQLNDSITLRYLKYPQFITRDYFSFDPGLIVKNTGSIDRLYSLEQGTDKQSFKPFDGLNTVGSISRGVTIGNNQNAVVNSELDLQITGKLSDKVSIRASIQDANIPSQQGGYSQSLDEFDQIFIELYSDSWNIRAGDVDLQNDNSYFGRFTKKVQGISLGGTFQHENGAKTNAFAAGALVRGVFQRSEFTGQEGNQGPYKLVGPNGELFILIVSGSERVYVNGLLLARGENADYVIDYNAGEIKFNPTYPITANMRITVEYQFTDRSYTRFIGYGGGNYTSEKLDVGVYVYSESDAKNQPLQQNLSEEQVAILQEAGDDITNMVAPSAVADTFSENKILYKKEIALNGEEIFVFSNNPEDELFSVRFSSVPENQGNYVLSDQSAISRIFEYVPPLNNVPQGNFEPIIQLNAPTKLQIGGLNGSYRPTSKTTVNFEIAGSQNDLNLFSTIDDANNDGFAGRLDVRQNLITTADTLKLDAIGSLDYLNKDFRTIERLYNIEFNRDWNLIDPLGDQRFVIGGVALNSPTLGSATYTFQDLDFSENFTGTRHVVNGALRFKKLQTYTSASILNSQSDSLTSDFNRIHQTAVYSLNKAWIGAKVSAEDNQVKQTKNDSLSLVSQRFSEFETFVGVGDSTKVYVEAGYRHRVTDSVQFNKLLKVNTANTYFLKSKLLNTANTQLSVFANYRELTPFNSPVDSLEKEKSLNSRILYNQNILKSGIRFNTVLEANNGVLPQQEFTYTQVEPGQGIYTWIDYNNNGIQELDEFEIAQFQDQGDYVRILLPNRIFIKVRENKFSQIITIDPKNWNNKEGFLKVLSKFYNQTSYVLNRKVRRDNDGFNINPFEDGDDEQLGLNLNFRNALFFNRGKQRYTTSYTYVSTSGSNLLAVGLQESKLTNHQLNFNHKFWGAWLLNLRGALGANESTSENFPSRNFDLDTYEVNPKLSYLFSRATRFDVFYQFMNEENVLGMLEQLKQQKIGTSFSYTNAQKISINGEFNYIDNAFEGSAFSPVAYQMLEGLQPGTNFTWTLLFQKRITKYLDANLSYFGRKSENSKTVHTGSIQLRAYF